MTTKFKFFPEVAGQYGQETIMDVSVHPPLVSILHHEFDGWLGDDILGIFPCYICTEKLKSILKISQLSGFKFDECKISKSGIFLDIYPDKELPVFYWLKIYGTKNDDFYIEKGVLIVSEKALLVLQKANIDFCRIEKME